MAILNWRQLNGVAGKTTAGSQTIYQECHAGVQSEQLDGVGLEFLAQRLQLRPVQTGPR